MVDITMELLLPATMVGGPLDGMDRTVAANPDGSAPLEFIYRTEGGIEATYRLRSYLSKGAGGRFLYQHWAAEQRR